MTQPDHDQFDIPVALLAYNRPDFTARALEPLRIVRPRRILVVADGPNASRADDERRCRDVSQVIETIDWPCRIEINRAPTNLGCRKRVQSGLDWVFDRVERAVIVEDDCVLDTSFFPYARELLDRYESNHQIHLIAASNGQLGYDTGPDSYYFSRYPIIWGWATWRRTWLQYDRDVDAWPEMKAAGWLKQFLSDPLAAEYWGHNFDRIRSGFDTWDYSLIFSCWKANGFSISPKNNLVRNIGWGSDATHTNDSRSPYANMPLEAAQFPLRHPSEFSIRHDLDARVEQLAFSGTTRQLLANARSLLQARRASGEAT
jgi:hypothetical protein